MLTSFAPSPIAKVYLFGFASLTKVTTYAFCLGETLQPKTTLHLSEIFINTSFNSFFGGGSILLPFKSTYEGVLAMWIKESPERIKAYWWFSVFLSIVY